MCLPLSIVSAHSLLDETEPSDPIVGSHSKRIKVLLRAPVVSKDVGLSTVVNLDISDRNLEQVRAQ